MKVLSQSRKDAQIWIYLEVKGKWYCKEQIFIGIQNVRSMNQNKLDVAKQEMASLNTDNLGISETKWLGMGEFNSEFQNGEFKMVN